MDGSVKFQHNQKQLLAGYLFKHVGRISLVVRVIEASALPAQTYSQAGYSAFLSHSVVIYTAFY